MNEKILIKVRGLLAQAADTGIPPEEADLFRQKADELMVKYAIASWQLKTADDNDRVIVSRNYDLSWYMERQGDKAEHKGTLWSIMLSIAQHCRVKVVNYAPNWYEKYIPVVGLESDMDWFDLLFTNVMADFVAGLEPRPRNDLSFDENVAMLKESGMKWIRISELLWHAGMLDYDKYSEVPTQKQVHAMGLGPRYTRFCAETNRPRLRVSPTVYRRSYSDGYDGRLWERLREMRRKTQASNDSTGTGTELVLADIWTRVQSKALELYPRPEPTEFSGKVSRARPRELKYSHEAVRAGRERADKVELSASKHRLNPDRKEIEG